MRTSASLMGFSYSAMFFDRFSSFLFRMYSYLFVHSSTICFVVVLSVDFPED
jgi:hypothetical protein